MSTPKIPAPAQLVLSVLSSRWPEFWPGLREPLQEFFGPVDFITRAMPFAHTGYYAKEMGAPLTRRLLGFKRLLPQDGLAQAKLFTNGLEQARADGQGRRLFNLDPGLLTQERLVLATGKNFTHRVYLGLGVWADLTLIWSGGTWVDLPWTFPDYAGKEMKVMLTRLRDIYREKIGAGAPGKG